MWSLFCFFFVVLFPEDGTCIVESTSEDGSSGTSNKNDERELRHFARNIDADLDLRASVSFYPRAGHRDYSIASHLITISFFSLFDFG